ncbi:MAG: alpha/beta hydrolase [Clostridiaceae bacterium]
MSNLKTRSVLPVVASLLVIIGVIAFGMNKIEPSEDAKTTMKLLDNRIIQTTTMIKVVTEDKTLGAAIIYPDEKVSPEAYIPLANRLAKVNITTFIVKYPMGLSFLERNSGKEIIGDNSEIKNWVVLAHGNGGPKAGYLADSKNPYVKGLVLMSADSGDFSLTDDDIRVVYIRGGDDFVNEAKMNSLIAKFPLDTKTIVIDKGHSSKFVSTSGDYDEMSTLQMDIVTNETESIINSALINTSKNRR